MLLMAGPMIVLFEGAIQIARIVDKRRARRDAADAFPGVGEDEPSPIDASPSVLDTSPSPLDSSTRG
jgi:sec-independent protein translocase protein TatC